MTQNVEKDRMISGVKFAALLLTLMIGCTSVGIVASYNLHSFWFTAAEPIVYPCPYSGDAGICGVDLNQPEPNPAVWYYNWPYIDPTHIHNQPQRSCILGFLYHDPLPPGTLRGEQP